jgi:LmbE family N-acetylglucosaminyl deacetylase
MSTGTRAPRRGQRLVVVSPHLDDAVLSIGASLAHLARRGVEVEVLTVFGGDPASALEAGASNRRAGFTTTGEAARVRRHEDDRACARLGVRARRLGFDDDEAVPRDRAAIRAALEQQVRGADVVLLPGGPLVHPDHVLVAELTASSLGGGGTAGLYREQPYATWQALGRRGGRPWRTTPPTAPPSFAARWGQAVWQRSGRCPRCQARKVAAAGAYRSQLAVLRRWPRLRIAAHEALTCGERISWPRDGRAG